MANIEDLVTRCPMLAYLIDKNNSYYYKYYAHLRLIIYPFTVIYYTVDTKSITLKARRAAGDIKGYKQKQCVPIIIITVLELHNQSLTASFEV